MTWSVIADLFGSPVMDAFLVAWVKAFDEAFSALDLFSLSLAPINAWSLTDVGFITVVTSKFVHTISSLANVPFVFRMY